MIGKGSEASRLNQETKEQRDETDVASSGDVTTEKNIFMFDLH